MGREIYQTVEEEKRKQKIAKYGKIAATVILLGIGAYQSFKPRDFEGVVYSTIDGNGEDKPCLVVENPRSTAICIEDRTICMNIDEEDMPIFKGQKGKIVFGQYNHSFFNLCQKKMKWGRVIDAQDN